VNNSVLSSSLPLILVAIACGVSGQLTLKLGMTRVGRIGAEALAEPIQIVTRVFSSPLILGGLGFYVLGAMVWLTVLSRVPLSMAYPMMALTYVFTSVLARMVLGERLPFVRLLGIATICLGVFLISRS
jgi:drug/metabolite transporter (DMT)-like permease